MNSPFSKVPTHPDEIGIRTGCRMRLTNRQGIQGDYVNKKFCVIPLQSPLKKWRGLPFSFNGHRLVAVNLK